ncbi:AP2/ERF domain-containing protein [Psidium guajava]|nr:AP2/ERF domain-containing protein [Psidium guajava]
MGKPVSLHSNVEPSCPQSITRSRTGRTRTILLTLEGHNRWPDLSKCRSLHEESSCTRRGSRTIWKASLSSLSLSPIANETSLSHVLLTAKSRNVSQKLDLQLLWGHGFSDVDMP